MNILIEIIAIRRKINEVFEINFIVNGDLHLLAERY